MDLSEKGAQRGAGKEEGSRYGGDTLQRGEGDQGRKGR